MYSANVNASSRIAASTPARIASSIVNSFPSSSWRHAGRRESGFGLIPTPECGTTKLVRPPDGQGEHDQHRELQPAERVRPEEMLERRQEDDRGKERDLGGDRPEQHRIREQAHLS